MAARRVARVLLDSPLPQLDRLFDYAIPADLERETVVGVRVRVPLRSSGRLVAGYVVELGAEDSPDRALSELETVVSPVPVLPSTLYDLARRVADRGAGSASDVLRLVIPKRMVRAERTWLAADPDAARPVPASGSAWATESLGAFPGLADAIAAGERLAIDAPPHPVRLPDGGAGSAWSDLLAAQAVHALGLGRSAIVVVPDHRDRSQVEAALVARVPPDLVVRADAQQSSGERYTNFLRLLRGTPLIVIGNRSAAYAPAPDLGLITIWDDGDPLLSEPLSPGVHARDVALVRQETERFALTFVGHTRTTDVERLVGIGWVREITVPRRSSPRVILSATREGEGRGARVPSAAFAAARTALEEGPVLVQVSRPGYAPSLVCGGCRRPARCRHCTGPLRASRPGATPECTWCGRAAHGWVCAHCEATTLRMASSGSERTAEELGRAFPMARIIVADGTHVVDSVDARPAVVVATRGAEPLAVGGYRAVLLLDADRMLMGEGLRVAEDCLRWWSNAAALAAPGAPVHLVGVAGAIARALATWTQAAYARAELVERAELRMPPAVRVASLEGPAAGVDLALAALRADTQLPPEAVLGPVAVPGEEGTTRALVRFEYALGRPVAQSLRAAVVAQAMRARRSAKGRHPSARNTLRVRLDIPDLDL